MRYAISHDWRWCVCQGVTGRVRQGEAVLEQEEVPEWVDHAKEGWAAPGREQGQVASVSAPNVGRPLLTKWGHPVIL
jgi:hypothetical protein